MILQPFFTVHPNTMVLHAARIMIRKERVEYWCLMEMMMMMKIKVTMMLIMPRRRNNNNGIIRMRN